MNYVPEYMLSQGHQCPRDIYDVVISPEHLKTNLSNDPEILDIMSPELASRYYRDFRHIKVLSRRSKSLQKKVCPLNNMFETLWRIQS